MPLPAESTVLITGATGQIGTVLRDQLRRDGLRIICLSGSPIDPQDSKDLWVPWPYGFERRLPEIHEPVNAVVHLGSQTSAYIARESPHDDLLSNTGRFVELLEGLVKRGNRPFVVLAGSATQAGEHETTLSSVTPNDPHTFYDVAKVASELYLGQFIKEGWVSGVCLRFSNVYGSSPALNQGRGFLFHSARKALWGEPLEIFRGCGGRRDFLHVTDAASSIVAALSEQASVSSGRYWVGSGESFSLSDALRTIVQAVVEQGGPESEIREVAAPLATYGIEFRDVCLDASAFRERALWAPTVPFSGGVRAMIQELLKSGYGPPARGCVRWQT